MECINNRFPSTTLFSSKFPFLRSCAAGDDFLRGNKFGGARNRPVSTKKVLLTNDSRAISSLGPREEQPCFRASSIYLTFFSAAAAAVAGNLAAIFQGVDFGEKN